MTFYVYLILTKHKNKYSTKKIAMKEEYLLKYDRKKRNQIKKNFLI